jgi:CheY-like chemotaxis protein
MNAVLGLLQLLQGTELTVTQRDFVDKTDGAARSLLGLLNDILDFSKVEAGKMALDPRPFNLDKLLADLSVILASTIGSKPVTIRFDVEPSVPRGLLGDDMRLQQVLINLGGNAVKFTHHGEVVLRVRQVERSATNAVLEFAMRDSGIGIAPQNQAHIFSGFSQAEASTTRRFGGTGLGLSISSRLVSLLGGELQLHSIEGQGSTFFFQIRFPLASLPAAGLAAPETPASPPPAKPQRLQGLRVLVVEDNKINQMVARGLLSKEGADITMADNGELGVAAVAAARPPFDVVLMDVQMPVMDGYAATRAIRQELGLKILPIIAMTANAMASDRAACLDAGMDDHIGKPFELDHLVATLRQYVGRVLPSQVEGDTRPRID